MHQIKCITGRNGKTEYHEWTYAKNEVLLEPGWVRDAFEFHELELYKLATTVTCDDYSRKINIVPIGRCNQLTTFEESKCEKKPNSALVAPRAYISRK